MKADYLSFKRAVSVSLVGLTLQLLMGLALLIYGAILRDQVGVTGGIFILALTPVWLVLAIVFDQHRRERIEAMENQALEASGAREASAFNSGDDDFRVQHKRLQWMHRVLVPLSTVLLVVLLAGLGVWRFTVGSPALEPDGFKSTEHFGWPITLGLSLGFIGFVFARYVAGMGKQAVWVNLKAGAAAAVGAAVVGVLIAVAQFIDSIGTDGVIRLMHVGLPVLMVLLAAEMLLNVLLGVYRPRRPGEVPRAAFESRVLGFVAAPDKIAESIGGALNYQFGVDVSSSWFYRLLTKSTAPLLIAGVAVLWLMTCLAIVQPDEQGMRVRFGRQVSAEPLPSGPYLKLPWPLERIETFRATAARRINLGVEPPKVAGKAILWTNDHGVDERYMLVRPDTRLETQVAPPRTARSGESTPETDAAVSNLSLVSAEIPLIYSVRDWVKFTNFADESGREALITAVSQRIALRTIGQRTLEEVLGPERRAISEQLQTQIQQELDRVESGVEVLFVGVEGVHPPRKTAESFEAIVQSTHQRDANVADAQRDANSQLITVAGSVEKARTIVEAISTLERHNANLPRAGDREAHTKTRLELERAIADLIERAGGSAASALRAAEAERWTKHMTARARAEAQVGRVAAYRACPEAYLADVYFTTLQEVMQNARVYVVADDGRPIEIRTNLEDPENLGSIFIKPPGEQ